MSGGASAITLLPGSTNGTGQFWGGTSLLPADRADVLTPDVHREIPEGEDTVATVTDRDAAAYEQGFTQVRTGGTLGSGQGQMAMDGAAWIESDWTPTKSGQHRIEATYNHSAEHVNSTFGNSANLVLTTEPVLTVVNAETGDVIANSGAIGSNAVSPAVQEYIIEKLLAKITRYILLPGLGLIGGFISEFILSQVFDYLIETRPNDRSVAETGSVAATVETSADTQYTIRFTANNGFSGQTQSADDTAFAESSSLYELQDFTVNSVSFSGGIFGRRTQY